MNDSIGSLRRKIYSDFDGLGLEEELRATLHVVVKGFTERTRQEVQRALQAANRERDAGMGAR